MVLDPHLLNSVIRQKIMGVVKFANLPLQPTDPQLGDSGVWDIWSLHFQK